MKEKDIILNDENNDDVFRVITGPKKKIAPIKPKKKKIPWGIIIGCICIILLATTLYLFYSRGANRFETEPESSFDPEVVMEETDVVPKVTDLPSTGTDERPAYTQYDSITLNDITLDIYTPLNAEPYLSVGDTDTSDPSIVLGTQATDVRADNGKITGSFVILGQDISHGYSYKLGYCSINPKKANSARQNALEIGFDNEGTSYNKACDAGGFFFRQHPLIVDGKMYNSTIKGKAIRKALCQFPDNRFSIVATRERESIHDFQEVLKYINVRNAIYLVGANSHTFMRDADGKLTEYNGETTYREHPNINYILWKNKADYPAMIDSMRESD